jgi:hypothetical protein
LLCVFRPHRCGGGGRPTACLLTSSPHALPPHPLLLSHLVYTGRYKKEEGHCCPRRSLARA